MLNVRGDVDILLFPVKPSCWRSWVRVGAGRALRVARLVVRPGAGACLVLLVGGCGYRSVASPSSAERLCVLAAPARLPDYGAVQGALEGAREELARHAGLGESGVYPCLVIELLRVDEVASGVGIAQVNGEEQPRARGTSVAVVGRARVQTRPDAEFSRDTGDMRRTAQLEVSSGALEGSRHDRGVALAGQALGRALARRILGLPTPSDELP